jgi:hypothetical protein
MIADLGPEIGANQLEETIHMAAEVRTHPQHPASMEQRIADRLKPSAGAGAGDVQVTKGTSPSRTVTTVHHCGNQTGASKPDQQ